MTSKIDNIIQDLKSLTLLEAAELVKEIEDVFGVDASASNAGMIMNTNAPASTVENEEQEQLEFDVSLEEVPAPKKIAILKVVRSITGLGLIDAKGLVESAPKILKEAVSREDAQEMKQKLEDVGAVVTVK